MKKYKVVIEVPDDFTPCNIENGVDNCDPDCPFFTWYTNMDDPDFYCTAGGIIDHECPLIEVEDE